LYGLPDRVDTPYVTKMEIRPGIWDGIGRAGMHSEAQINDVFDTAERALLLQVEWFGTNQDASLERNRVGREAALSLFRERKAVREEWENRVGYKEAQTRCTDAADAIASLDKEIRDYRPTSFAEVHEKAAFAVTIWNEHCDREELFAPLKSFTE
jgi:hypothetical protein